VFFPEIPKFTCKITRKHQVDFNVKKSTKVIVDKYVVLKNLHPVYKILLSVSSLCGAALLACQKKIKMFCNFFFLN